MIDGKGLLLFGTVFMMGFVAASLSMGTAAQMPFSQMVSPSAAKDVPSPYDWVPENRIRVTSKGVFISIENPVWARFTDTNSMDPVLDEDTNAIEIVPSGPEDIHVGDIVSYKSKYASGTIIHRVIETGEDEDGWYARMKGDNNPAPDPGKVRFEQIQRVVVALIY